jgi:tripartite ATP-independent transporter DctP family solute receptor
MRHLLLAAASLCACLLMLPGAHAADPIVLKLATVAPEGTPWSDGLAQFKTLVETKSGGAIKVKLFLGGMLGDENETVQQTQRGQIQGVGGSTGAIATLVPEVNVLELPFLFRNAGEADKVLDGVALPVLEKAFRARGLVLGFWSENGYRSFGTSFGFIKSPADLKGRKMRSQVNPVHLEMYKAFGASPVPIPTTEVLTSLQTGVIQGYDQTPLYASAGQWLSSTKYYTLSNHIYQPAAIVFNKTFFDGLSAQNQAILLAARAELVPKMRREIRALNPILLENFPLMGVQLYTPNATELASFEAPAKTARDAYMAKASTGEKELYKLITADLSKMRGGK